MCNEGHFLVLQELAEKEKIYKDRFNINRVDKKELRRRYFLLLNYSGVSQPQNTFVQLLRRFLSFRTFQLKLRSSLLKWCFFSLKKLTCDVRKLPRSCFQVLHSNPILVFVWQRCENPISALSLGTNFLSLAIVGTANFQ